MLISITLTVRARRETGKNIFTMKTLIFLTAVLLAIFASLAHKEVNGATLVKPQVEEDDCENLADGANVYSENYKGPFGENKFMDTFPSLRVLDDDYDIVLERMQNLSRTVSSNITEILAVQEEELKVNEYYRTNWTKAVDDFYAYKREEIFRDIPDDSIIRRVPEEYHIAILAYTGDIYSQFNRDTRYIINGEDINNFQWKSYFKLLELAVQILGSEVDEWTDKYRYLYRGIRVEYNELQEGNLVAFQSFTSTSANLPVAECYSRNVTLFEIQGYYTGTSMAVYDHSYKRKEREILFLPNNVYRVDSIHDGRYYKRIVLTKPDSNAE